jgi:fructose-1,6-bisphosphatase/inositol monophosphatase family enzyme
VFAISFALVVFAVDPVDGTLNYVIALLLSPILATTFVKNFSSISRKVFKHF